ncbi:carboxypeptidase-like regulatory domain-containing protein [Longitalea arenae]|uniref:carboxypeptidase-like regulatory domain-containing protein n=1 Tax=Longitalea arenae TaxID=2812558 RepID=UPI001967CE2E|nr:carboxypeptidase-like regulatory domain-containing protein [Longitalea arenae]
MKCVIIFRTTILLLLFVQTNQAAFCQVLIKGTVYDKQARFGVPHVSVLSSSGTGTITDSLGRYSLKVPADDSVYFSYLGKMTSKFPVKHLPPDQPLDISLPVAVDSLASVTVRQPSYRMDSLANRAEYKKVFDYDPVLASAPGSGFGLGISFDLLFNTRKIRSMEKLKARLEREEREKYVDHRFTKALVKRITGLRSPALDTFMIQYRPSYEQLKNFETEYEYYQYIKTFSKYFIHNWKIDHPHLADSSFVIPPGSSDIDHHQAQ